MYNAGYHTRRKRHIPPILIILLVVIVALIGFLLWRGLHIGSVGKLEVTEAKTDAQTLSWSKVGRAEQYEIYRVNGDEQTLLDTVAAGGATDYTVTGLKSATLYQYRVIATRTFLGKTRRSKAVDLMAYSAPESVKEVTAATESKDSLTARWEAVKDAEGYEVSFAKAGGQAQVTQITQCNYTADKLTEGEQYEFKVRAYVAADEQKTFGEWSPVATAKVIKAVDMTGIDVTKPMIALTFDDGPDFQNVTTRILDVLKKYNAHASFFQLGDRSSELPKLITRIAQDGHEVACHTYDHSHYGKKVTESDIVKGNDAIEAACGTRPDAFRSPGGMTTDIIRKTCIAEGMPIYYWSVDTEDWKSRNADSVYNKVVSQASDGDIVLMHNIYPSTADAVERIVPYLVDKGYQLVTVAQLVQAKTGKPPEPGVQYYTATHTN